MSKKKNVFFVNIEDSVKALIPGPFYDKVEGFDDLFQASLYNVTENLAKSGVTVAQKTLRNATTEWGKSRMAGNHFGVRFSPYGRSSGREKTGNMYDSLTYEVQESAGKNIWKGSFGWDDAGKNDYIQKQENGFMSYMRFDPVRTAATGIAKFKEGEAKWVPGAKSLPAGRESIRKRMAAAYSAAWNEAASIYESAGGPSPGNYLQARARRMKQQGRRR